ncbi:MAG: hypothetical protein GOMPHAMPRED_001607 [Gomphillus americanus]|uniref:Cellular morphogenesis protein n=1 Tax=Gomphillus americanus TaxID=1940652 RepID=A0A8H3IKE9_9LECA|nr:MAG: hypothetical protein GOMPHAMPRED_001607 [Gomphillus americanus]
MRFSRLFGPTAWTVASLLPVAWANFPNFTTVPSADLDLGGLGRVALTGNFESISVYSFLGQSEITASTNGSQSLFAQLPNGAFQTLAVSDGSITAMCPFVRKDGNLFGVIVGGNFTSLAGIPTQGIALFNVSNNAVVKLSGLTGSVNAVYCDQDTDSVFVGGDFKGSSSTNAIAWVGDTGWTNMPFQGFNAPVYSIAKAANGNIIWGGSFSGLANMSVAVSTDPDDLQVINFSNATISAGPSSSEQGFSDPKNVVCQSSGKDEPGATWLVQPGVAGHWQADFNFAFQPSKIRLWNTRVNGSGTKTWRFMNNPNTANSILELRYTDPATQQETTCFQACPLSNDTNLTFQDFYFVNPITMNSFRIEISEWYGQGAGLDGIEIFQTDIFSYAIEAFNEPSCSVSGASAATAVGPWTVTPSQQSSAQYLTAKLPGPGVNSASAQVTFQPDIKQSGNYTVVVYTPGCLQDNDCSSRGIANITGTLTQGGPQIKAQVFQTNSFDKYDQIYTGYIDAGTDGFRPSITLQPLDSQNSSIDLVALRVGFTLLDPSSTGLNGLFEYDPYNASIPTEFKEDNIDAIGINLDVGASVDALLIVDQLLLVGGTFTGQNTSNFIVIDAKNNSMPIPGNGLNGPVHTQANIGNTIYLGGSFNNTNSSNVQGISNVATFDTGSKSWGSLGSGVDGPVSRVVPLGVVLSNGTTAMCMSVNGDFNNVLASGGHPSFAANGFAIWVPSQNGWLKNLGLQTHAISGQITATTNLNVNNTVNPLMSGTIVDEGYAFQFAAQLSTQGGNTTLGASGLNLQQTTSSTPLQKRDTSSDSAPVSGIYSGIFDTSNGRDLTVFGGHFQATATDSSNITNLAIINNSNNGAVTGFSAGIDTNSTVTALSVSGDTLYAGGSITGNVQNTPINGFVAWNLKTSQFNSSLPPALGGSNVTVAAISPRPSNTDIYVAGNFDSAGGLGCPGVCVFSNGMWARPGTGFNGNVSGLLWQANSKLLVVGNLSVSNTQTSIATYDATTQTWSIPNNANNVPGPIAALSPASKDGSSYWVGGQSANGSAFLMHYDGSGYETAPQLGDGSIIRSLSVLSLTQGHGSNAFLDDTLSLLVTGSLNVQPVGSVSGALFDGTSYTPFLLTNSGSQPGSLGSVITQQPQVFNSGGSQLAVGLVVLIGLAIALALLFLLVLVGLLIERHRRAAEGYRPAPQNYFEKTANMGRIPPERLFGNLNTANSPRL